MVTPMTGNKNSGRRTWQQARNEELAQASRCVGSVEQARRICQGKYWEAIRNRVRANRPPCWRCGGAIMYDEKRTRLSFTLDHVGLKVEDAVGLTITEAK